MQSSPSFRNLSETSFRNCCTEQPCRWSKFVTICAHLVYFLFYRATVENHKSTSNLPMPPVQITISNNELDFIIKYVHLALKMLLACEFGSWREMYLINSASWFFKISFSADNILMVFSGTSDLGKRFVRIYCYHHVLLGLQSEWSRKRTSPHRAG